MLSYCSCQLTCEAPAGYKGKLQAWLPISVPIHRHLQRHPQINKTTSTNPKESTMRLQFVDQSSIGPEERRRIRSHVMKGKNAGRPRPTKKKLPSVNRAPGRSPETSTSEGSSSPEALMREECRHTLALTPLLYDDLALSSFPEQLGGKPRARLHQCKLVRLEILRDQMLIYA
jgi:hypothetical protein